MNVLHRDAIGRMATVGDERRHTVGRRAIPRLEAPLNHILRNCVDHGIESPEERGRMLSDMMEHGLMALPSGTRSIRFRLPFILTDAEVDQIVERVAAAQSARV